MTICFFGHRKIYCKDIKERLLTAVEEQIKNGADSFIIGTHGDFDTLSLTVCRELRNKYPQIKISVVFTTLTILKKDNYDDEIGSSIADYYKDVETMIYDIEEEHFKQQIIISNRKMIDDSDKVICYVKFKEYRSGAKRAVTYAKKQNKDIINLYKEQDSPFYGMTREEINAEWQKLTDKLK